MNNLHEISSNFSLHFLRFKTIVLILQFQFRCVRNCDQSIFDMLTSSKMLISDKCCVKYVNVI